MKTKQKTWEAMSPEERDALVQEHFGTELVGLKKRGLWWRPNGHGYTYNESEAWKLTPEQAKEYEYPHDEPTTIHPLSRPAWTTSLPAAFEVVEKIIKDGASVELSFERDDGKWFCRASPYVDERIRHFYAKRDSLPEAICLAALRAKGIEV